VALDAFGGGLAAAPQQRRSSRPAISDWLTDQIPTPPPQRALPAQGFAYANRAPTTLNQIHTLPPELLAQFLRSFLLSYQQGRLQ
jgi:hypothetical protein